VGRNIIVHKGAFYDFSIKGPNLN